MASFIPSLVQRQTRAWEDIQSLVRNLGLDTQQHQAGSQGSIGTVAAIVMVFFTISALQRMVAWLVTRFSAEHYWFSEQQLKVSEGMSL